MFLKESRGFVVSDDRCAVVIEDLRKAYQNKEIIKGLRLKVPRGGIFGLLGPNGAGKTTLMKMIAGLSKPTAGTITIFGSPTVPRSVELKKSVGLIPQDSNLERELCVEEALTVYARLFGIKNIAEKVEETIKRFHLEDMRSKNIRRLSGGMMRRVLIARTLMPNPELLLLDEPTVGLDPDVRHDIWTLIRQLKAEGRTLILTTHYMEEAERLCDYIAILKQGQLAVCDTVDGIKEIIKASEGSASLEEFLIQLAKEKSR
jgi:ABC-type multidrug transport system ATPase subunit